MLYLFPCICIKNSGLYLNNSESSLFLGEMGVGIRQMRENERRETRN